MTTVALPDAGQVAAWRADTPGCAHRNHLNNAGAALMPRPVIAAIDEHIRLESEIGGYEAADARADAIAVGYDSLGTIVGARRENIAVVGSATAGFVQALSSFDFAPGDAIVTTRCDYTSNQIQYLALAKRLGVEIVHAEDLPTGGVDAQSVREIIARRRPRLVAVSWIPTNSGLVQDVDAVGVVCEDAGVPYVVDACQAVGQIPIDVARLRCDYLSATGRKFMRGPRGIGFMFASDRALARGDHPLFVDMRGARWRSAGDYEVAATARRYEDWEFPYALVLGQAAAARYALEVGVEAAQARAWALAARLRQALGAIPRVQVLDRGANPCAIVTMTVEGMHADAIVRGLKDRRINTVSSLREFGIYDFEAKGIETAVRLSPHYYNTEAEVDVAVEAVRELVR
ncbi:MAG TPA: aminotransferase class V-fold PLP-dependent enzyme [Gemmatimonadaceae bacterium]|nr:aminotransferase class V-fold PLP-dependent enzyme [Gemmatimonadaceae bacterium]